MTDNLSYEFDSFRLVPAERQLLRNGQAVSLPPKAFDTLVILVQNHGHALKKDDLLRQVWPDSFVEESNLSHYISVLRRALSNHTNGEGYVETVRGYGFRFNADVRASRQEQGAVLVHRRTRTQVVFKEEASQSVKTVSSTRTVVNRKTSTLAIAMGCLIVGGLAATYFAYIRPLRLRNSVAASAASPATRPKKSEDPAAREAYLKGRSFWNQRTPKDMKQAVKYFREAVNMDPNYAPAYAGMADAYLLGGVPDDETEYSAKDLARKALSLDDTLAEAHASLAYYLSAVDWNWAEAEVEFRRSLELDPNYATAHHWYAYHLTSVGRLDEALSEIKRAREIDPNSLTVGTDVGHVLYLGQNYIYATAQYGKVLEQDPNFADAHLRLGEVYVKKHMFEMALGEFQKAGTLGKDVRGWLAYAYAASGHREKSQQLLHELQAAASKGEIRAETAIARVYATLGDQDRAFVWLQEACTRRDGELALVKSDPTFETLRSDPRFGELLRRMGLPS